MPPFYTGTVNFSAEQSQRAQTPFYIYDTEPSLICSVHTPTPFKNSLQTKHLQTCMHARMRTHTHTHTQNPSFESSTLQASLNSALYTLTNTHYTHRVRRTYYRLPPAQS